MPETLHPADDPEIDELSRVVRRLRAVANESSWRRARQERRSRIAIVLRQLRRLFPAPEYHSVHHDFIWAFLRTEAAELVASLDTSSPGKTLADIAAPVLVTIFCPYPAGFPGLERLEAEGAIRIVVASPASQ